MSPLANRFLQLYEQGWFPMADRRGRLGAYCYDPRGILPLDEFHVPARLARTLRRSPFRITHNHAFAEVIQGCADRSTTWISQEIVDGFVELHKAGLAHSLEAWEHDDTMGVGPGEGGPPPQNTTVGEGGPPPQNTMGGATLAGGLYGLALGATFCGESMFFRSAAASKACLVELNRQLRGAGFRLIDCQQVTPTLAQFGARWVPFEEYFRMFQELRDHQCDWRADG